MQSGMRDAFNLSWKLWAVLRAGVDDSLLATYQVERQPNVTSVTNQSIGIGRLIEIEATRAQRVRNRVSAVITSLRGARKAAGVKPELFAGFITGVPSESNAVGKTIPQPYVATQTGHRTLFDNLLGTDFAVVGLDVDPRVVMSPDDAEDWTRLGARFVTLRSADAMPEGDDDIVDFENVLAPWFHKHSARVLVIRPDRFVAATDSTGLQLPPETQFTRDAELVDSAVPRSGRAGAAR
jgi:3-(3-hydroxy-phenyl)propionate hydroxylase